MSLISVKEAEHIIMSRKGSYGIEQVPFSDAVGRVLAEPVYADRDMPPYNRVTMDGIALSYAAFARGIRSFAVNATMAAGDVPVETINDTGCIELMTGCVLPGSADTVIRYEDLEIKDGIVTVLIDTIRQGANVHRQGSDRHSGDCILTEGAVIDAAVVGVLASVGQAVVTVYKLPRIAIISTGDELVDVHEQPSPAQIRRSNSYSIQALLQQYRLHAHVLHIHDDEAAMQQRIATCLSAFDVLILSGGVSMGRYDYVPAVLQSLGLSRLFHKVAQRPGKPFWFGTHHATATHVFAFPGNPVSAFMCAVRYFIPWLRASIHHSAGQPVHAVLGTDVAFMPQLQYFMQVVVAVDDSGRLVAMPLQGNGSGDFANLTDANAFMELPEDRNEFKKGDIYSIWPFRQII